MNPAKALPLSVALLLLSPAVALAQSDADRATARELAAEGQGALEAKDYAKAADRFARAESLIHAPTLLLALGRAQAGLGKLVAAREAWARVVREGVEPWAPAPWQQALADAKVELDKVSPRVPSVVIAVSGSPGPTVTVDGAPVPVAALGVKRPLDPGRHVVHAEAAGMAPTEATLDLKEGESKNVSLVLAPLAGGGAVLPGAPSTAPAALLPLASGRAPGADTAAPPGATQKRFGLVSLGLGVAGLGMGVVTGLVAVSKHAALGKECATTCPSSASGDRGTYYTMGGVSTTGFIVAGVAGGAGTLLLVTLPKSAAPKAGWLTPYLGLGTAGATGAF